MKCTVVPTHRWSKGSGTPLARDGALAARDLEVDARGELLAVALVAPRELEHHAAAHDVLVIAIELLGLLADGVVQGIRVLDAVEGDLEGYLHEGRIAGRGAPVLTQVKPCAGL